MFISSMTEWPFARARIASPMRMFLSITSSLSGIRWGSKFTLSISSSYLRRRGLSALLGISPESVLAGKTLSVTLSLQTRHTYAG